MTRESEIERPAWRYAVLRRWVRVKIKLSDPTGFPDHFFARNGEIRLVEFKRPGETPNEQQLKRHRELREAGVQVYVFDDLEEFKKVFR